HGHDVLRLPPRPQAHVGEGPDRRSLPAPPHGLLRGRDLRARRWHDHGRRAERRRRLLVLETVGAGLRPLTTTAIVDAAVEHVRDDPVLYYGIVAPVSLPLAAISLAFLDLVRD